MNEISLQPVLQIPRAVRAGASYLVTVDMKHQIRPEDWPYDREEYPLTCLLESLPYFEHRPLGDTTLLLHRFGGTYGEVRFLIQALKKFEAGCIRLLFVDESGLPVLSIQLPEIRVESAENTASGWEQKRLEPFLVKDAKSSRSSSRATQSETIREDRRTGLIFSSSIDGTSGRYLHPAVTPEEIATAGLRDRSDPRPDPKLLDWLKNWISLYGLEETQRTPATEQRLSRRGGPVFGSDALDLSRAGWGVIYAPGTSSRIKRALLPLLDHRRELASRASEAYYREFEYDGENVADFLRNNGARPDGAADPDRGVPYYLLLVGDLEAIPYRFQHELDVRYAVGRIHFDHAEDYENYARSILAAEKMRVKKPSLRQVAFFGVKHDNDPATQRIAADVIEPLANTIFDNFMQWEVRRFIGPEATRERLIQLLGGLETPALLVGACHGLAFPPEDPRQLETQGALVCGDWSGPSSNKGISQEHYLSAEDIPDYASLQGLIAFFFSDFGVGTPEHDDFEGLMHKRSRGRALRPFISRLPQRLLAHPNGGASAFIGRIGRSWIPSSAEESEKGEGLDNIQNVLMRLLAGHTVGSAMEYFNQAYAVLAARLANLWENQPPEESAYLEEIVSLWIEHNNARDFVIFGDPAVKLSGL